MERKKQSKGRGWESCYVKKIYGTFGVEMRAYGQKFVTFCTHTHTHTHAAKLVVEMLYYIFHIEYNDSALITIEKEPNIIMQMLASSASHSGD